MERRNLFTTKKQSRKTELKNYFGGRGFQWSQKYKSHVDLKRTCSARLEGAYVLLLSLLLLLLLLLLLYIYTHV